MKVLFLEFTLTNKQGFQIMLIEDICARFLAIRNFSGHFEFVSPDSENFVQFYMSIVRKPDFRICENKGVDHFCNNYEADQHLCLRYTDSTISVLLKSENLACFCDCTWVRRKSGCTSIASNKHWQWT